MAIDGEDIVLVHSRLGLTVRLVEYGRLSAEEFEYLLLRSEEAVPCTGDMSFSQVVSSGRVFLYQMLGHKMEIRAQLPCILQVEEHAPGHQRGAAGVRPGHHPASCRGYRDLLRHSPSGRTSSGGTGASCASCGAAGSRSGSTAPCGRRWRTVPRRLNKFSIHTGFRGCGFLGPSSPHPGSTVVAG